MMSDAELRELAESIRANGLQIPISFYVGKGKEQDLILLDGRNRLEAMERHGVKVCVEKRYVYKDPVAHVIGANINRRHLTKHQQAELIVAAHRAAAGGRDGEAPNKPRQVGDVSDAAEADRKYEPLSMTVACDVDGAIEPEVKAKLPAECERKGGRGKINAVKAAAVATAKEHGISKRTVERALAASLPKPKPIAGPRLKAKPKLETHTGIEAARRFYLEHLRKLDADARAVELDLLVTEIKAAVTHADLGDLPAFLDRRRRP
jgi:ParB-like chromosome segregation protein Spo0J